MRIRLQDDWAGLCALVLSLGLAIGWVAGIIILAWHGRSLGETGGSVASTLGGAIVGAIASYLGGAALRRERGDEPPPGPSDSSMG